MLQALLLEFALTTACAKLSLLERGCSGMVYLSNSTANARTSGARFVCSAAARMSASSVDRGSSSELSSSCGLRSAGPFRRSVCNPPDDADSLARLAPPAAASELPGAGRLPEPDSVRLRADLHAPCKARADLASLMADSSEARGASAICLMLRHLRGLYQLH